jgi:hypothetical protein
MTDLKELILEFEELIGGGETSYSKMVNFLKGVSRRLPKNVTPPMIEFITVLKEENPDLFYQLREHIPKGTHLHDLIRINISYDLAKERLNTRKNRIHKRVD